MPLSRSTNRNTFFYDATNPEVVLGGFRQNGSITEANFLFFLDILLVNPVDTVRVQARTSGYVVTRTNTPLSTGAYDIFCEDRIRVSREAWVRRLDSRSTVRRQSRFFRDAIRNRDRGCVISGRRNLDESIAAEDWVSYEAAHIFPLACGSIWNRRGYGRLITDMPDAYQSERIHSPQNGFLLRSNVHQRFDQYLISVNPDDGYKIVSFIMDDDGFDGRILDPACRDTTNPHCVPDFLLRWHFRQSVLANMRGAGEPIMPHHQPRTDRAGGIPAGPYEQGRFELEIAA